MALEWADLLFSCFGLAAIGRILRGSGCVSSRGTGMYTVRVPKQAPVCA